MGEGLRSFDKESRNYSAIQGIEGILAAAIQTDSVYTHFFGNMFLKITTTTIPTKLFNDKMQALLWLEQFKSATSIINKTDLAPSLS